MVRQLCARIEAGARQAAPCFRFFEACASAHQPVFFEDIVVLKKTCFIRSSASHFPLSTDPPSNVAFRNT